MKTPIQKSTNILAMVMKLAHAIRCLLSRGIGFDKNVLIFSTELKRAMKKIFDASYYWSEQRQLKKYEKTINKINGLISSITNNSANYHEKYMKNFFSLDNNLNL